MISKETIDTLARRCQTSRFPNIIREYFQHIFLSELYKLSGAEKMFFKGGTALRIIYGSPRFSEDLDFSLLMAEKNKIKSFIEDLFVRVLSEIEKTGIKVEIGKKVGPTSGGYFGIATFSAFEYPPVAVEINVSVRSERKVIGEVDSIINDFVPAYTIIHLPQTEIIEEKIFGALINRKKPRDFYDLYFIMRKGMLSFEQKKKLAKIKNNIITDAKRIDFKNELGVFLPADQHAIIKDFPNILKRELERQVF